MKRFALALVLMSVFSSVAFAQVSVNGYTRQNGTYVQPYTRTAPDNTINNNYSTSPNVNPYTGQQGHIQPQSPTYSTQPGYGHNGTRRGY
jgi:hypothetical protein